MQPAPEATLPANHTWRSYYHAAGRRITMSVQDGSTGANQAHYLFADHLGDPVWIDHRLWRSQLQVL